MAEHFYFLNLPNAFQGNYAQDTKIRNKMTGSVPCFRAL